MEELLDRITVDADVLVGKPVIRGTCVPVFQVPPKVLFYCSKKLMERPNLMMLKILRARSLFGM